ncbi:MAG: F0F1 ATP synthase subunit epsilon [bacterium]
MNFGKDRMILQVITPEGKVWEDSDIDLVVFRTIGREDIGGEIGVLRDHAPLLARTPISSIRYIKGDQKHYLAVAGGFIEVRDNRVTILSNGAEKVEREEELKLALEARERTEAWLKGKIGKVEFDEKMAEVEIKREAIRMYKEGVGD